MSDSIPRRLRAAAGQVKEAVGLAAGLGWLFADHVRRRLTGRPGLFDELFADLHIELEERDIHPPYDDRDAPIEEARTKQTARHRRGPKDPQ